MAQAVGSREAPAPSLPHPGLWGSSLELPGVLRWPGKWDVVAQSEGQASGHSSPLSLAPYT